MQFIKNSFRCNSLDYEGRHRLLKLRPIQLACFSILANLIWWILRLN